MHHGLGAQRISQIVVKADGKSKFSDTAVQDCMNKLLGNPRWRGERAAGSGAERKTTGKQDKALVKYLLQFRGKKKSRRTI
jgi:hypothetical protein